MKLIKFKKKTFLIELWYCNYFISSNMVFQGVKVECIWTKKINAKRLIGLFLDY